MKAVKKQLYANGSRFAKDKRTKPSRSQRAKWVRPPATAKGTARLSGPPHFSNINSRSFWCQASRLQAQACGSMEGTPPCRYCRLSLMFLLVIFCPNRALTPIIQSVGGFCTQGREPRKHWLASA